MTCIFTMLGTIIETHYIDYDYPSVFKDAILVQSLQSLWTQKWHEQVCLLCVT